MLIERVPQLVEDEVLEKSIEQVPDFIEVRVDDYVRKSELPEQGLEDVLQMDFKSEVEKLRLGMLQMIEELMNGAESVERIEIEMRTEKLKVKTLRKREVNWTLNQKDVKQAKHELKLSEQEESQVMLDEQEESLEK